MFIFSFFFQINKTKFPHKARQNIQRRCAADYKNVLLLTKFT